MFGKCTAKFPEFSTSVQDDFPEFKCRLSAEAKMHRHSVQKQSTRESERKTRAKKVSRLLLSAQCSLFRHYSLIPTPLSLIYASMRLGCFYFSGKIEPEWLWRSWWFSNAWDHGRIRDGNDFIIVWLRRFRSAEFLWREIQISLAFGTKSPLHSPISWFWVSKQFSAARKSLIKNSSFARFSFPWWGLLSEFEPDMKRNEGRTRNFGRRWCICI